MININENPNIRVDTALILGVTPFLIIPNTRTGKVLNPAPLVKKVITKSSRESVKASSAPPRIPGMSNGSVTNAGFFEGLNSIENNFGVGIFYTLRLLNPGFRLTPE